MTNEFIPEKMNDFFTTRLDGYEEHMLTEIGLANYRKVAELVPDDTKTMLDLGCGTGLELDEIFQILPEIAVTGIDLTQSMLNQLKQKHPDKHLNLICGNYLDADLGENKYDCIVSVETMHHFREKEKVELYKRIHKALKPGKPYIESDFIATEQSVEDEYMERYKTVWETKGISTSEMYHIDIPFTIKKQISLLKEAGFFSVESVFLMGNTAIFTGIKT